MQKLALALVASVLAVYAAGCAKQPAETTAQQPVQQAPAQSAPQQQAPAAKSVPDAALALGAPATLDPMDAAQKKSQIATSFPEEVPVIEGKITRGEAQGDDAWDYELAAPASAKSVAAWYLAALGNRGWGLTDVVDRSAEGGKGYEVTLVKNGAQTRVTVTPKGEGSIVSVVLGVGAPVLQTQ
ncbi:MAG TPA: hypothetical protein VFG89_08880 [Coriobacteriia bacterium]|nr:hypothetical protein [Coriobacteriia bacterium]